jgi:hypothetical protein
VHNNAITTMGSRLKGKQYGVYYFGGFGNHDIKDIVKNLKIKILSYL